MAHSYAQSPTWQCSQCGASFVADIWLIIDTAERPDLLGRVMDGSIHTVVCPNRHAGDVDAPLLLYRPGEETPLLFSPARQATVEQDREMAGGLVALLRDSLGGGWRDEWLEGFSPVTREWLPALLSGDAAALQEALADAVPPGVATEIRELLGQLGDLNRLQDMPRRIAILQEALRLFPADGSAELRAALQVELGNAMAQNPLGERAANLEEAIAAYRAALQVYTRDAFPEQWATTQNNLGAAYRNRIRGERAANLEEAIAAYRAALDGINESFLELTVSSITDIQRRWAGLYARATAALLEAGRPAEALAVAEGSKSRLLTLLVSRGDLPAPAIIPTELITNERRAAAALAAIDAGALADHNRDEVEPIEVLRRRGATRAALLAELRAAWDGMAACGPEAAGYVALRRGDRPTAEGLARLAGSLPAGAALLSLFDTGERTLLFLWRGGVAAPLVVEAALGRDALYYDYLANYVDEILIARNRADYRALGRPLSRRWCELGRPLLGPLLPHLAGIDHLIIAPEGVLHQLPLHALRLNDAGETLIDHCAVSYIPALGLLERIRRRGEADAGGGAAVMGYTDAPADTEKGRRERAIFEGEARAVAARLGVAPLLDEVATAAALEAATTDPVRVLHLSCHGYFNTEDALASGVLLADGVYTAREFMRRRLRVDLVTLSACQTAISDSLGGDEMAGLSMGLLSAGASSLLLGMWSVNAVTTAALMDDFYRRLDGAATKAETLRQTMLAFRDGRIIPPQGDFDPGDPYYWAPFVLVGDWR